MKVSPIHNSSWQMTHVPERTDDPNFPSRTMRNITMLVQGYKAALMDEAEWIFSVKAEAAVIHFHSPYPEVRAVTLPYDEPDAPCETIRAYFLGMIWMAGASALNAFFQQRQPSISLGANVLQILVVPCGKAMAKVLPDWGVTVRGRRWSLNPGPWTYKEQVFTVVMFDISEGFASVYQVYFVQKLPQYLKQDWVTFGYEILLALSVEFLGFGFAGLLRRFVIFPVKAMFPSVLPTLALSRALVEPERYTGKIHGWTLSRYRFFCIFGIAMFLWFFIPNFLFQALHAFNWMTWISPQNFTLAMITGFYGGMGFNPLATFDWNVSGAGDLTTPFFSLVQSHIGRVSGGLIIIAMYWSNMYWSAYMPINSNQVFNNLGVKFNAAKVLDKDGNFDLAKYEEYGPPYYSAVGIFLQASWFAWMMMLITYVTIRYWPGLKMAYKGLFRSIYKTESMYEGHNDAHTRMIRRYPEVPEWWFALVLLISFFFGVAAVTAWPTSTPWWSLLVVIGISGIILVPVTFLMAQANVSIQSTGFYHCLSSVLFPNNPQALMIFSAFGINYINASRSYILDVKMGHYAKIPPRALFRGQMMSLFIHTFVFIGVLEWLITDYNDGTLCTWDNKEHFVCAGAVTLYSNTVMYGVIGAQRLFKLYPIIPWCFLIGAVLGTSIALAQRYAYKIREICYRNSREDTFEKWDRVVFNRLAWLKQANPAIIWAGAHNWGGGVNLSYAINGLYVSFFFMYYVKRRYPAWWEKYNYLLEMAFGTGIAFSGLIQDLAFKFGPNKISAPVWWGNTVSTAGIDYSAYNQKGALLPVPKGGFGLKPAQFP